MMNKKTVQLIFLVYKVMYESVFVFDTYEIAALIPCKNTAIGKYELESN